jgi:hypothetical protein
VATSLWERVTVFCLLMRNLSLYGIERITWMIAVFTIFHAPMMARFIVSLLLRNYRPTMNKGVP